jgi:gliding motility-associated-like protein
MVIFWKNNIINHKLIVRFFFCACFNLVYTSLFAQQIPVVVHIISANPDAVTDAQIINAIQDLNDAFAHTGAYSDGPGANTGITFCLAKTDPSGGISNGITRTTSVLGNFDYDIENNRLKNLVSWDTRKYCNIWYVEEIKSEINQVYSCGRWRRDVEAGYATFPGDGDYRDGIVVTGFGKLLAHETGHYLGLRHSFTLGSCANNNCETDGDGICDTPPSASPSGSCAFPQNSCTSDTLSGFKEDQPDMNANFMTYSSCRNMFTAGQANKMKEVLGTVRNGLLQGNRCEAPCSENIFAGFTRDNWLPSTGSTINFTSTSTGGANYQWSVDGVVAGSNSPNFSFTFPDNRKYSVTLKVYNGTAGCFASYSNDIIVTCGVLARFYPDKRLIASKLPILIDTILFKNRSENATAYQWLMSNNQGMAEQIVSTETDLFYGFNQSGNYKIRMIAINGGCRDTTETFSFSVLDPTVDGTVNVSDVQCYQQTKLRVTFSICNNGYATIPAGTPISFYDADPRLPGAHKIDSTFLLPNPVTGRCCGISYTLILDIKRVGLNSFFAVFNDKGTVLPVQLPNADLPELNYANNFRAVTGFRYTVSITPAMATLEPGDTLQLTSNTRPGTTTNYAWSPAAGLSCVDCQTPLFIAAKEDVIKKLIATSSYGCYDSAFAVIKVPPADDFVITINSVDCYQGERLRAEFTVCNQFRRGVIPTDLQVSFYNGNPASANSKLLGPVFKIAAGSNTQCMTFTHIINSPASDSIFAVVNDRGNTPYQFPNDTLFLERNTQNNTGSYRYQIDSILVSPANAVVIRNQSVPISILSTVYDPSSVLWLTGNGYTLNCTNCITTQAVVEKDAGIRVQMSSRYGCRIFGESKIRILPPDMVIRITDTKCFTNNSTLVSFQICMNNGYDSVFKGIPVSFYDRDPYTRGANSLGNTFMTPSLTAGSCDTFSTVIETPETGNIYAVVNDKGNNNFPDTAFAETDLLNNAHTAPASLFSVSITPEDTSISRLGSVLLTADAQGGSLTSYSWQPVQYLSCSTCLTPVAKPPYTMEFSFEAKNEYNCTAEASAIVRTHTEDKVHIPNAFTPNGDARNDIFYIMGTRDIAMVKEFSVYDRYGQRVFNATNVPPNNPAYGWNGISAGKPLVSGTYVYQVVIEYTDLRKEVFKGHITLIR